MYYYIYSIYITFINNKIKFCYFRLLICSCTLYMLYEILNFINFISDYTYQTYYYVWYYYHLIILSKWFHIFWKNLHLFVLLYLITLEIMLPQSCSHIFMILPGVYSNVTNSMTTHFKTSPQLYSSIITMSPHHGIITAYFSKGSIIIHFPLINTQHTILYFI